jgi:hypothetical protein
LRRFCGGARLALSLRMSLAIRPMIRPSGDQVKFPGSLALKPEGRPPQPVLGDSTLERLIKLIPADVAAVYVPALGLGSLTSWPQTQYALVVSIVGTLLVPLLLYLDARAAHERVPLVQYVVRTLCFVVWALLIGKPLGADAIPVIVPALTALVLPILGERLLRALPPLPPS